MWTFERRQRKKLHHKARSISLCIISKLFGPKWKVPQLGLSFAKMTPNSPEVTYKWHFKTSGQWTQDINVINLLVYTWTTCQNSLPGILSVSFPPFMLMRSGHQGLLDVDNTPAACSWGKLSDHSAYLSPVFLINIVTAWVVIHRSSGQKPLLLI